MDSQHWFQIMLPVADETGTVAGTQTSEMEGEIMLFNHKEDMSEMENVAEAHPEIVHALRQELRDFKASLEVGR